MTPRIAVAAAAAFGAMVSSVAPSQHAPPMRPALAITPAPEHKQAKTDAAWPPSHLEKTGPGDVTARIERTSTGAYRLVVEKTGDFVHLQYREVGSAGPDWASIEMREGDRAPKGDVAVWEHTDPRTLVTSRGTVRFSLREGTASDISAALPPRSGPIDTGTLRTCQSHEDLAAGYAVVCHVEKQGVRAIRPTSSHPLAAAWVWDLPKSGKVRASSFVRIDLPLSAGGAEAGAIAYVHGGKGFLVRADATWPSAEEPTALLFSENSRKQPVSDSFTWR